MGSFGSQYSDVVLNIEHTVADGFLNGNAHGFSNGNAYDFTSPYYFLSIFTIRNLFVFSGSKYEFSFHIARLYTYLLICAYLMFQPFPFNPSGGRRVDTQPGGFHLTFRLRKLHLKHPTWVGMPSGDGPLPSSKRARSACFWISTRNVNMKLDQIAIAKFDQA